MTAALKRWGSMFRKRGKYFWLASGAVVITAALLLLFFDFESGSGVSFDNKPLNHYWFRQMDLTMVSTNGFVATVNTLVLRGQRYGHYLESQMSTSNAFRQMGTNCLPFLVDKLGRHDSSLGKAIQKGLFQAGIKRVLWRSADLERAQAVTALVVVNHLPQETLNQIRALTRNPDPGVAASAKWVLARTQVKRN
jgi:hypothetical protein